MADQVSYVQCRYVHISILFLWQNPILTGRKPASPNLLSLHESLPSHVNRTGRVFSSFTCFILCVFNTWHKSIPTYLHARPPACSPSPSYLHTLPYSWICKGRLYFLKYFIQQHCLLSCQGNTEGTQCKSENTGK